MSTAPSEAPLRKITKKRFLAFAHGNLNWDDFENIRRTLGEQTANKTKYLKSERWLHVMWRQAKKLDLLKRKSQRILDLGTGPGHFPYVCQALGHDAWGLDRPGTEAYEALTKWMGVRVVPHKIRPGVPLSAPPGRFDLVTAFRIGFNSKSQHGNFVLFDIEDWAFFLDDIRDRILTPGGRVVLKMIRQDDYSGPKFGDAPLMEYFESRGAVIKPKGRIVWFDPLR